MAPLSEYRLIMLCIAITDGPVYMTTHFYPCWLEYYNGQPGGVNEIINVVGYDALSKLKGEIN